MSAGFPADRLGTWLDNAARRRPPPMPPELLADLRNILAEHKILTEHLIECPAMAAEAATAPVPCVYFDQPGHTPDQRPDPIGVWPDDWPMCPPCAAIAKGADADHPEAAPR